MTAFPDPIEFTSTSPTAKQPAISGRPKVGEHYWGYEISTTERGFELAVLARSAAALGGAATLIAVTLLWIAPAVAAIIGPVVAQLIAVVPFLILTVILVRLTIAGTRKRVQIDTTTGEIREVVAGPFGAVVILASWGVDTVQSVSVAPSRGDPNKGHVKLTSQNGEDILAGDGATHALYALRDRVASDCGLGRSVSPVAAVWPSRSAT